MPQQCNLFPGKSIFIEGDAGRIHVRDFCGHGPTVIALHGVTGGSFLWEGVAAALDKQCRLIALDLRGHGLSDWSDSRHYTTDAHARDLEVVLDALNLNERPVLMGSSWGALAMIRLVARKPEVACGLIVIDVEPSFESGPHDVHPRPYRFASLTEVDAWERKSNPNASEQALSAFALGSVIRTEEGLYLRRHDPFFLTNWPFRDDDLWDEIPMIRVPVKVIHGESSFVRESVCRTMADRFANGNYIKIADCGHLVPLEQPARIAEIVRDTAYKLQQ